MIPFSVSPYVPARSISAAWPEALRRIVANGHTVGEVIDQNGKRTYELEGLHITLSEPLKGMIPTIPRFTGVTAWDVKSWLDEYFEGEIFSIDRLGFDYIYGEWLVPGILHAVHELEMHPTSRRIIIPVGDADDMRKPNPPCLRELWLHLRNGRLNGGTFWRSREFAGAAASNMYGIIRLISMAADELGVPMGTYEDISASAHINILDNLWWVEKVIR